jgi:uncharacterized membrane protein
MSNRNKKDRRLVTQGAQPPVPEFSISAAFRQGPLPPPEELAKYESLYPGATKLLFDNFISQTNHRMDLEKLTIQEDNKRANKAQRNSFMITIAILILAGVLFFLGKDGAAIAAVFTAIAPIIIAFITSSVSRRKERENKRRELGL